MGVAVVVIVKAFCDLRIDSNEGNLDCHLNTHLYDILQWLFEAFLGVFGGFEVRC